MSDPEQHTQPYARPPVQTSAAPPPAGWLGVAVTQWEKLTPGRAVLAVVVGVLSFLFFVLLKTYEQWGGVVAQSPVLLSAVGGGALLILIGAAAQHQLQASADDVRKQLLDRIDYLQRDQQQDRLNTQAQMAADRAEFQRQLAECRLSEAAAKADRNRYLSVLLDLRGRVKRVEQRDSNFGGLHE